MHQKCNLTMMKLKMMLIEDDVVEPSEAPNDDKDQDDEVEEYDVMEPSEAPKNDKDQDDFVNIVSENETSALQNEQHADDEVKSDVKSQIGSNANTPIIPSTPISLNKPAKLHKIGLCFSAIVGLMSFAAAVICLLQITHVAKFNLIDNATKFIGDKINADPDKMLLGTTIAIAIPIAIAVTVWLCKKNQDQSPKLETNSEAPEQVVGEENSIHV